MDISTFEPKAIPGLYNFDHYEAPNGAFIQASARRDTFVFQDKDGQRQSFNTFAELKKAVEGAA